MAQELLSADAFRELAEALKSATSACQGKTDAETNGATLEFLRQYFRFGGVDPRSVYETGLSAFTQQYSLANIVKNWFILTRLDRLGLLQHTRRIVDLGCGPGTFTFAYALWRAQQKHRRARHVELTMVDAVSEAFKVFQSTNQHLNSSLGSRLTIKLIRQLIRGRFLHYTGRPDIIVFSNSLSEILRNPHVDTTALIKDLKKARAVIIVVDYGYSTSWNCLDRFATEIAPEFTCLQEADSVVHHRFYEDVDLGHLNDHYLEELKSVGLVGTNIRFCNAIWIPRTLKLTPTASPAWTMVEKYKRAWESHDLGLLKDLFTGDALYNEKADAAPLCGIESICRYWSHNASTQTHVHFHAERINMVRNTLIADWQSELYRKDLHKWMKLRGEFHAKTRDARIEVFEETFEKQLSDRRPPR